MKYLSPHDHVDCGPTCLRMICRHHGKIYSSFFLQKLTNITKQGVSLKDLEIASNELGFESYCAELSLNRLIDHFTKPCILYWDKGHFVVLYKILKKNNGEYKFYLADPGKGKVVLNKKIFSKYWLNNVMRGFGLFLNPTKKFYKLNDEKIVSPNKRTIDFLNNYFVKYRSNYAQVFTAIFISSFVSLVIPYITQGIVDYGVQSDNMNIIVLLLIAQLALFLASLVTRVIRAHLLLHIGTRINISILTDFLEKLLKLPLSFFDSKRPGDLLQRINDHKRIEKFITTFLLTSIFAIFNLIVYSTVLVSYSRIIFFIFILGASFSVLWAVTFMHWRRSLDYIRFNDLSENTDKLYELVHGIHEIKVNGYENNIKDDIYKIQLKLFKIDISSLKLDQYQKIGNEIIKQLSTIFIIYFCAKGVVDDQMTLGMMIAITFIIGQINEPISQLIELINTSQTSNIGVERMSDIYQEENEIINKETFDFTNQPNEIKIKNLSFKYQKNADEFVLKNINAVIPVGKTTAIVGMSGSGKTTLLKLLLGFYKPDRGTISIGDRDLHDISMEDWRKCCGTVMQDSYIFSDSISKNITMAEEPDLEKIISACEVACIDDFIAEMPLNIETQIGKTGIDISEGQKQRILIARAVYKNPYYIFLDEATSSLDAINEKMIHENLDSFVKNKTAIIIAHRLSTVKNADQILVIKNGMIVESGDHKKLINNKNEYYTLVKNQLELDNS